MKLNLLFIVLNVLTILAYPVVFLYGKLGWFSKSKGSFPVTILLVPVAISSDR